MKRIFCFLFVLLFAQGISLAKEPSFYEEFNQQEELEKQEENNVSALQNGVKPQDKAQDKIQNKAQGGVQSEEQGEFFLTDEKHAQFLQENEQYALADSMLNQTWKVLTKKLTKKEYRKLWQKHKNWLDSGRNAVADSFKKQVPTIPEYHAFMLAAVAKTQELAQSIWHDPVLGRYVKDNVFVTLVKEDGKIFLQGYANVPFLAKNTDTAAADTVKDSAVAGAAPDTATDEKTEETAKVENSQEKSANNAEKTAQSNTDTITQADTKKEGSAENQAETQADNQTEKHVIKEIPQLLFRAELPQGKLWLALTTVNEQKLYLLTTQNSLCIVHAPNTFSFDFNGIFVKK